MSKSIQKEQTVEERYKFCEDTKSHILSHSNTYIGNSKMNFLKMNTFSDNSNIIIFKEINVNEGLFKIFDEILVNASDNTIRCENCNTIKVTITDDGYIEIYNNGDTIPITLHKELNIYIPQMLFSKLYTSENYDLDFRVVGGAHGIGSKATNIFSKYFEVEILNAEYKKHYTQIFKNNMSEINEPIIVKTNKKESYTKIKFLPDYKRFGMEGLTTEMINLFKRRTYDIVGTSKKQLKVYWNDELINIKSFEDYMKLYYENMPPYVYQCFNENWSIGIIYDNSKDNKIISFVNGLFTEHGGTHVNYIKDQLLKKITEEVKTKHKNLKIKNSTIMDNLSIFINATINNATFNSQSKEMLKNKASDFTIKCELDDKFIKKICKTGLLEDIVQTLEAKQTNELKKTDATKKDNLQKIIKLSDANWAGTKKSCECSLILTEGDSAKALVVAGNPDPNKYGIFPLKGKSLNVREATKKQLLENEELINIKKIIGLTQNTKTIDKLRYGRIIILSDADVDGIHIKGLLINLFHLFWRDLLPNDFIQTLPTPIIKAHKKTDKKKENCLEFYTKLEYENWLNQVGTDSKKYEIKYYKGLGTYTKQEAKQIFENFEKKIITYVCDEDDEVKENNKTDDAIILAFDKRYANDRKEWIKKYDENLYPEINENTITINEFVNKELIHFSIADNIRSIPNIYDGLKVSQRKVLFAGFKRKLDNNEIKVSQFAGYISEHTEYHHGEASLNSTIVGMAQDFWCSNNINLFKPNGQFGTRITGGKDSASPRYIFTQLNELSRYIFRVEDEPILKYINEEGTFVEPETYYPIIPMVLINHIEGIGTGFSTNIPSYNPLDIVKNLKLYLSNKKLQELIPWTKFFEGVIEKNTKNDFDVYGTYKQLDENTILVTELPLETWTETYKAKLESMVNPEKESDKKEMVKSYKDYRSDTKIGFEITFYNGELQQLLKEEQNKPKTIEKELKLKSSISLRNMHLWKNNVITKYESANDILKDYAEKRLEIYDERKEYIINLLENEMLILKYTKKYIEQVLEEEIIINKQKQSAIIERIEELEYPKLSSNSNEEPSYHYLTKLLLFQLTFDKIQELNEKYNAKKEELEYYKNTTNKELWLKELEEFEKVYIKWYDEQLNQLQSNTKETKKTTNKKSKK